MTSKLNQYLFSTKAIHEDFSSAFTEQYGIPIEVRTRKTNALNATAKPDKLIVTIPDSINFSDPQTDFEKSCVVKLNEYIADVVKEFAHVYKEGKGYETLNTTGDLKDMISSWASDMNVPAPPLKFDDSSRRFGYFKPLDGGYGAITLNNWLKFVPKDLAETIIVHELSHAKVWKDLCVAYDYDNAARISNRSEHPKEFWDYYNKYMPDNKDKEAELNALIESMYSVDMEAG